MVGRMFCCYELVDVGEDVVWRELLWLLISRLGGGLLGLLEMVVNK
jgi:hypothetical protein